MWPPCGIDGSQPTAGALQKLAQSTEAASQTAGGFAAWPTLWLVCGYSIAALAGAGWLLQRRDT